MDIRVVESMATAGSLSDLAFRVDPNVENVSLVYDEVNDSLVLTDANLNHNTLPSQLGTDIVKKTFLTYNGVSTETKQLIQTVVMESAHGESATQEPGFNNSYEWVYNPASFKYPGGVLPTMSDPSDTSTWPYDQSQGITVVKQFLGGQSGLVENNYKAFYRAPVQHSFQLANADITGKIYKDGWYTSYVIDCKTWDAIDPLTNGIAAGDILYRIEDGLFYINTTGVVLPEDLVDLTHLPINDTTNWKANPNWLEWMSFLKLNMGAALPGDPVYFIETQHLVTADLSKAILAELKSICGCCTDPKFGMSHIEDWMKLTQKRAGAYLEFNKELFTEAQCIIESTRKLCFMCLYHKNECLFKPSQSC
jgi:hypothetical protein